MSTLRDDKKERGFIDGRAVASMFICFLILAALGGVGLWELIKYIGRHVTWL